MPPVPIDASIWLGHLWFKRIVSGAVTFDIESSYRVDIASTGHAMTKLLEITGGRAAPIDKIKIV